LSNAYDVVLDEIAERPLAGALALDAVLGGHTGPRSPGTVLALLYRLAQGARHLPQGGVGAFCAALGRAAEAAGAEIRRGAAVVSLVIENDRAAGVMLVGGERIAAPLELSSLDAQATLRLTGVEH